jgi:NADH-quinone oxidoreductase subunit C
VTAPGPITPAPTAPPVVPPLAASPPPPPPFPGTGLLACATIPFHTVDHSLKGYHLDAVVTPDRILGAATELDNQGMALDTITGVDWLASGEMEIVYDFFHPESGLRVAIRTRVPRTNPTVATISAVFPGANWHERETHDFFGIDFIGHPNLTPFLLPEDATYHPLRKDFTS